MHLSLARTAGVFLIASAGVSLADGHSATEGPRIYAFQSHENYCPEGLQPVSISGTICCGTPNQEITYQQVMAHAAAKKRHSARSSRANCPVGTKGCTFD